MSNLAYSGGTHTVASSFDSLEISAGANVTINTGAVGIGHVADTSAYLLAEAAIVSTASTLDITGGTFTGGSGVAGAGFAPLPPEPGLVSQNDSVTISGGTFASGSTPGISAQSGAAILLPTAVAISGGTFTGGGGGTFLTGGSGLSIGSHGVAVDITGGTFTGGAGTGGGAQGFGLHVRASGSIIFRISAASISGGIGASLESGSTLRIQDSVGVTPVNVGTTTWTITPSGVGVTPSYHDYIAI